MVFHTYGFCVREILNVKLINIKKCIYRYKYYIYSSECIHEYDENVEKICIFKFITVYLFVAICLKISVHKV